VQNSFVTTFTASGLDLATVRFTEGYNVNLKYQ
jgi:hypothetical protein